MLQKARKISFSENLSPKKPTTFGEILFKEYMLHLPFCHPAISHFIIANNNYNNNNNNNNTLSGTARILRKALDL